MKNRTRLVTSILGVAALWLVPSVANAQTTISSVKVTVSGATKTAVYCDTALATCPAGAVRVWNLAGGVHLTAGQTLVLSQTGLIPNTVDGNFDTSDRVDARGVLECTASDPCAVAIEINGVAVYTSPAGLGDQLVTFNHDIAGNGPFDEAQQYGANVVNQPSYTLALGYADNEHNLTCPAGGCFPSPFGGTYTVGQSGSFGICSTNCFDAGALLITAKNVGPSCTVTQGGWGAAPHGNNPAAFLAANFPVSGVTIGGAFSLHFTTAQGVESFLPQGGPPSFLNASATNPTTSSAGVFGGQVLALELNVTLKGDGGLVLFGTGTSLDGKTLTQVLAAANLALGGGALPAGFTYSSLNDLVDDINNAFDGCSATAWATAHLH
jgi:hypothetical protein